MTSEYTNDVKLIKALADENRLHIMKLLLDGEKCGCVLLEALHIQQPTLSHHMKILCEAGLVDFCKEGKWIHYSVCSEGSTRLQEMVSRYTLCEEAKQNYQKCKSHDCKSFGIK